MAEEEEFLKWEESEVESMTKEGTTKSTTEVTTVQNPRTMEANNLNDLILITF